MPVEIQHDQDRQFVEVNVTGQLTKSDYDVFVPEMERLIEQHGRLRVLFNMIEFEGWTAGAMWEDLKFDTKHFSDIERLAALGDKKWQQGMTTFFKPFTKAEVRYFDRTEPKSLEQARTWLETGQQVETPGTTVESSQSQ